MRKKLSNHKMQKNSWNPSNHKMRKNSSTYNIRKIEWNHKIRKNRQILKCEKAAKSKNTKKLSNRKITKVQNFWNFYFEFLIQEWPNNQRSFPTWEKRLFFVFDSLVDLIKIQYWKMVVEWVAEVVELWSDSTRRFLISAWFACQELVIDWKCFIATRFFFGRLDYFYKVISSIFSLLKRPS